MSGSTSGSLHTTVHTSNTVNKTVLKTKLQFYDLLLSMRDSDRALNVDENRLTRASSLAAVDSSGTPSAVDTRCRRWACTSIGHEVVVVKFLNSSIMNREVHRQLGGGSVDGLASLDCAVMVDQWRRTTRYGSLVCLDLIRKLGHKP